MKPLDLLRLIFGNLSRRKARVGLTAVGVVIGTAAVVILVSLGIGLQRNANEQLYGIGDLTQIQVMPMYGGEGMVMGGGGGGLSRAAGADFRTQQLCPGGSARHPGCGSCHPADGLMTGGMLKYQKLEGGVNIIGIDPEDLASLKLEAAQGDTTLDRGRDPDRGDGRQ